MGDINGGLYDRRRIDELTDVRIRTIEDRTRDIRTELHSLDAKVDALSARMALLIGGLGVLSFVLNIVGPVVVRALVTP